MKNKFWHISLLLVFCGISQAYALFPFKVSSSPDGSIISDIRNRTEANFSLNSGNEDVKTFGLNNELDFKFFHLNMTTEMSAYISKQDDVVSTERYKGRLRGKYDFFRSIKRYSEFLWYRDQLAGIENQWNASTGISSVIFKRFNQVANALVGFQYRYEEREIVKAKQTPGLYAEQDYEILWKDHILGTQKLSFNTDFTEIDNYEIDAVTAIEFELTKLLNVRNSYILSYRNKPVPGFKHADHRLNMGLVFKWR